jgi:hypothetical protein
MSLVPFGSSTTRKIACEDTVVIGTKVVMKLAERLASGEQYYVRVETGGLLDIAGNKLPILMTRNSYVLDTGGDTTTPAIVATLPCEGCEGSMLIENATRNNTVALYLSEQSQGAPGGLIRFFDCLDDLICDPSSDVEINTIDISTSGMVEFVYEVLYVHLGVLQTNRRYRLVVEANSLQEVLPDGSPGNTGPTQPFSLEFVKSYAGFVPTLHSTAPAKDPASAENLTFPLKVPASTKTGTYTVCYCNDQQEGLQLEDVGDGDTTYILVDDETIDASWTYVPSVEVVELSLSEHVCQEKCSEGCTGPFCFCDGYDDTDGATTLCLPPGMCRDACDLAADCSGISVHDTKNQCLLFTGGYENVTTTVAEAWQTYERKAGRACTHLHDYREIVGTIEVTKRVQLEVEYVLEPGQEGSIEVVAAEDASLTYGHSDVPNHGVANRLFTGQKLLSEDRITLIDGYGLCGISAPSKLITLPGSTIEDWMNHNPHSWFREGAHEDGDAQNVLLPDPVTGEMPDTYMPYTPTTPEGHYASRDGFYCPGRNLDLDALDVVFDGTVHNLREHQCYTKCGADSPPCEGDDCFCSGHYSGYDGPDSNAICADVQMCQYICDQLAGCGSIDMHKTKPRCFLNLVGCNSHSDALYADPNYAILFKRVDGNDEQAGRGNHHNPAGRRLLEAPDAGFSWDQMLRFKGLQFSSGGRFKLCFCDSEIHSSCNKAADYGVEVGEVHVSGVSCLVANPRLQRVACATQFHGGLRCYPLVDTAPMPEAPEVGMTALPSDDAITPLSLATKCTAMSLDEAEHDPDCAAALAEYAS